MKKKKKNNEKSLVKILSGFIKEDYSNNKKKDSIRLIKVIISQL